MARIIVAHTLTNLAEVDAAGFDSVARCAHPSDLFALATETHQTADAALLDGGDDGVVNVAEGLHLADRLLSILIVCPVESMEKVRRQVLASHFLGAETRCIPRDEGAIVAALRAVVSLCNRQDAYRRLVVSAQSQVSTLDPPKPRPADLLDRLMEEAPIGIVVLDDGGRILQMNRYACTLLDVESTDLVRRSLAALLPEDARDALQRMSTPEASPVNGSAVRFRWHPYVGVDRRIEMRVGPVSEPAGRRYWMVLLSDV